MRTKVKAVAVAGILGFSSAALTAERPALIDGTELPRLTEVETVFHCDEEVVRLHYREQRRSPDEVERLSDAVGVSLLGLTVAQRSLSVQARLRIERLFERFAWVERAELRCTDGRLDLRIIAMDKRSWIDFFEQRRPTRPRTDISTITILPSGDVEVEAATRVDE